MDSRNALGQMTDALRKSEGRLSRTQAMGHMGDWEWDLATNAVKWSDELYRIYGFEPHEINPDYNLILERMPAVGKEKFLQAIDAALKGEKPFEMDYTCIRKDGSEAYLHTIGEVFRDESGTPTGMAGIVQDISERKSAEEKIQKNEKFVRDILDTVDAGFIVVDRDYKILTANRAYCGQIGLAGEQIVGRHCFEVSHKRSSPCYEQGEECSVKMAFASGKPRIAHHLHEDADGNRIYVETKAFPLRDASGKVSRAIETITDITEKRLLEDERLKVQKLEAIGTLAGGLAHDFNNLLQGVFGFISLAKMASEENKAEKTITALQEAEKALQLSAKLTNQLLTFSRGGKPHKMPTDVRAVLDNAVRFALSGSPTDCMITDAGNIWQVEADEGQITQVVQNIILNAAQAMPGGGRVEITTRNLLPTDSELPRGLQEHRYVEIAIRDEGIGIPAKHLTRIFDPYFTTKEKGSGLGLATSYSIIKNHGGLISVTSKRKEGTTFFIYLPALKTTQALEQPDSTVKQLNRAAKILVMDDEPMVLEVASSMIKLLGHKVVLASEGEEAVAKYEAAMQSAEPFDAVVLDLTIRGGLGGAEAMQRLQKIHPEVKAVVSSGYAVSDAVTKYRDHGFLAFLNKPYNLEGLRKVLDGVLN